MDPLSITASIAGILGVARHIHAIITHLADAREVIRSLRNEIQHIEIIFSALQRLVTSSDQNPSARVSLIQTDDIVIILTQTVLVFSKLQPHVESLVKAGHVSRHLRWSVASSTITRYVDELQRHKSSLTLVLQILQCDSLLEARTSANRLHENVIQQVHDDSDMARRIVHVQNDMVSIRGTANDEQDIAAEELNDDGASITTVRAVRPQVATETTSVEPLGLHADDPSEEVFRSFDRILSVSRPYLKVEDRSVDDAYTILSERSKAWSALSYWSLDELSTVAVISLPLDDEELEPFQILVQASKHPVLLQGPEDIQYRSAIARLQKELAAVEWDPPSQCGIGPIEDDLFHWQGSIIAPMDTPYNLGVFFLDIEFPTEYPLKPPLIKFTNKIYHPNIGIDGTISLDVLLDKWRPRLRIHQVMLSIRSLLENPNPSKPYAIEGDVTDMFRTDRRRFDVIAREWTRKYAYGI